MFIGHRRDNELMGGHGCDFVVCHLIDGDDLAFMGEAHLLENHRCDGWHGICVTMTQENVVT